MQYKSSQILNRTNKYLALGDSYTIGESIPEQERWPIQLVRELNILNLSFDSPQFIAKTGWTTDELNNAIRAEELKADFDLVSLSVGVNNQYRGRSLTNFRKEYKELLDMAVGLAKKTSENVLVVSIPDWGVSPFAKDRNLKEISTEIDAFNSVKEEETLRMGAKFVNITEISRMALNKPSLIASDKLHFASEMYKMWVDKIISSIFKVN